MRWPACKLLLSIAELAQHMAKEIERKFLVNNDGWQKFADTGTQLQQAYLMFADGRNLRIRILSGQTARLTLKIGTGTMTRDEFEYPVPLADAQAMLEMRIGTLIEKTRYRIPAGTFTFEVDVFAGALSGLVIAEVEMQSETDRPALPDWLGAEVTGDPRYYNQAMALHGRPAGV
jgi:CYTH domain-containing protein